MNNKKTVLVTGASRGIGLAIAEAFAQNGYTLFLTCDKTFDKLSEVSKNLIRKYGIECTAVKADVGNFEDVRALFEVITNKLSIGGYDNLDVVVNNAGTSHIGLMTDMSPEQWQRVIDVNLNSCFFVSKNAVPIMLKRHCGRIINISSIWGNDGASMEVAYSASKGGVNSFTKALAKELAPSNIQVNAIACGVIDTQMNAVFSKEEMEALIEEIPADRLGTTSEVARLALLLANAPEYMTGQILTISGGF